MVIVMVYQVKFSQHLYARALYSFPLLQRLDKIDKDLSPLPDQDKDPGTNRYLEQTTYAETQMVKKNQPG